MLKTTKSITLTGNSFINDKPVVYMSANVSTKGDATNHTLSIQDKALYDANKEQCRADILAFDQMVYDIEDNLQAEQAKQTEVTEQ